MGEFDLKYAAYERAMQQNNYFGLTGEGRAEQFGRYAEGLQYDEKKQQIKKQGVNLHARWLKNVKLCLLLNRMLYQKD